MRSAGGMLGDLPPPTHTYVPTTFQSQLPFTVDQRLFLDYHNPNTYNSHGTIYCENFLRATFIIYWRDVYCCPVLWIVPSHLVRLKSNEMWNWRRTEAAGHIFTLHMGATLFAARDKFNIFAYQFCVFKHTLSSRLCGVWLELSSKTKTHCQCQNWVSYSS